MEISSFSRAAGFTPRSLQQPGAWVGHIPFANWLTNAAKPEVFVELGTHTGNSYFAFCQSIQEADLSTTAYAVDTWAGDKHAGYYNEEVFDYVNQTNQQYKRFSTLVRKTFEEAANQFPDKSIDLLHIDGLHTYNAVSKDFFTWLPKMSDRGIVIMHDTEVFEKDFGVHQLFKELSAQYESINFLHSHGLGVLRVGGNSPDFIPKQGVDRNHYIELFKVFGNRIINELAKKSELDNLQSRILELEIRSQQMKESLHSITESFSWKLTYPLRAAGKLVLRRK